MLQFVAAGAAIVGAASSIFGSISGAKEKKKAARAQARFTYAQRMEEIRRKQYEQAQVEGGAVAAIGASNLQMSGSPQRYVNELRNEHSRQIAWANQAAENEKRLIRDGGQSPGLGAEILGSAASGISSAIGGYKGAA